MTLTPQAVREKTFTTTKFKTGYDEDEVDAFLDEVEAEIGRLIEENEGLRAQVAALQSAPRPGLAQPAPVAVAPTPVPPPPPPVQATAASGEMEDMLRRTLLLAQRTADQAVAEATAEADRLRSDAAIEAQRTRSDANAEAARVRGEAAAEADRLVATARQQAESQLRDAHDRRQAALATIEADRRTLETRVEALQGFEREYRTRLKAYLELQLRELDKISRGPDGRPASRADGPPAITVPPVPGT
jgi:DivIVA domain-containing protein